MTDRSHNQNAAYGVPADATPHPDPAELRRQAVEKARSLEPQDMEALSPGEIQQALHELRVHQIQLEMQNEELRRAHVELDAERARYFDLYDLAPVGYCTLGEQGLILEANLTAATLLGVDRGALLKQPLTGFILSEDQDVYYRHRKALFETGAPQACELRMLRPDCPPFWALLEATVARDSAGATVHYVVLHDITERKRTDAMIRKLNEDLEGRIKERTAALEKAEKDIRALAHAILTAQEKEREMISRELHDTLAQDLCYIRMAIKMLRFQPEPESGAEGEIEKIDRVLERDIATVRHLSYDLGTPGLKGRGLVKALSDYCEDFSTRTGLAVEFHTLGVDETKIHPDAGPNLYRLVQEGLHNVLKHAKAKSAFVRLKDSFPNIALRIIDDGQGFDVQKRLQMLTDEKKMGLRSMQERVTLLGGEMRIRSQGGAGTLVYIRIPYQEGGHEPEDDRSHR